MSGEAERVAAIVKMLTRTQREAILEATDMMSGHGGYPFFVVHHTGEAWPKGVAQFLSVWKDRLTPLGLAVRTHLKETQHEG